METPNYYHFVATFEDGTQIFQDETDLSLNVKDKSQFYDVLEKEKQSPLICFVLIADGRPTFGVDLRDGHFEVNGVGFFQHRADRETMTDLRIIYFRNVRHDKDQTTGDVITTLGYTLGWQTNCTGQNIQKIIKI